MHVLISVVFAVLMQTPGVHVNAIDAAVSVEQAAVSHDVADGRVCSCRSRHHAR